MLSLRLKTIASLVPKNSIVLDVGTDHAYLPIYLYENKICKKVIASDISKNALDNAKRNIQKHNIKDIKLYLTDGIENIDEKYDTLTISGMGTNTIIGILNNKPLPNNIIISSNNDLYTLRKYMNSIGYKIKDEIVIKDKKIYYDIISYIKGIENLKYSEVLFGKSNNKDYYKYLYEKEKDIFKKVNLIDKIKMLKKLMILKKK